MDLLLNKKRAIVCASSKGLGYFTAQELFHEGCEVVICSRNLKEAQDAAEDISRSANRDERPYAIAADLSTPEGVTKFFNEAINILGGVDILINNVGGPQPSSAEGTTVEAWRSGFEQLFLSASLLSQLCVPLMKKQNFGRIITITSLSVLEPINFLAVSTAMRAAVTAYMKSLSNEVAPYGITANTVMPGVILTDRIVHLRKAKAARDGTTYEEEMQKTSQNIPMNRLGRPDELAGLIAFLASPRASYITAANIPVDGGQRHGWV